MQRCTVRKNTFGSEKYLVLFFVTSHNIIHHDCLKNFLQLKNCRFKQTLLRAGVIDSPTTSRNPQANSVCERMHQTVANILRTTLKRDQPINITQGNRMIDNALAAAMHATRCSYTHSIGMTPGEMVFHRDMFFDVPIIVDLLAIRDRRQTMIDSNLIRQNEKRREYHYAVGQQVLMKTVNPSKLEPRAHGPYPILQVYTNGTVDVLRAPHVIERINIRRLVPYKQ